MSGLPPLPFPPVVYSTAVCLAWALRSASLTQLTPCYFPHIAPAVISHYRTQKPFLSGSEILFAVFFCFAACRGCCRSQRTCKSVIISPASKRRGYQHGPLGNSQTAALILRLENKLDSNFISFSRLSTDSSSAVSKQNRSEGLIVLLFLEEVQKDGSSTRVKHRSTVRLNYSEVTEKLRSD